MAPNADDSELTPADFIETRPAARVFIGRYEVIRLLGRGGMGEVYLAHDPVLDREVAVKLIGGGLDGADARRLLVQEARTAGRLRHPNIVTIFDAGEHGGRPYVAMEYVEGDTLRGVIQRRVALSLVRRLELIEAACAGLAHAHRQSVVHFDVKPDNLMVDSGGVLKVLDFGIARVLKSDLLVTQHVAGTLRYMSPEQVVNAPLDHRSDVFSLGCSIFELIAYEPAYAGSTHEITTRIAAGPVPRLADVLTSVDPRLDDLVARAMALNPEDRFDDLDELGAGLTRVRQGIDPGTQTAVTSPETIRTSASRRSVAAPAPVAKRPRRDVLGVAAVVTLAIGLGAVWMNSARPAPREDVAAALGPGERSTTAARQEQAPSPLPPSPTFPPRAVRATPDPVIAPSRPTASIASPSPAAPAAPSPSTETPSRENESGSRETAPLAVEGAKPASPTAIPSPSDTTSVRPGSATPATAAPPLPVNESDDVLAALRRYHEGYRALDTNAIQQMYPSLGSTQIDQLRRSFDSVTAYDIDVRQPHVDVRNNTATVRGIVARRITPKVGRPVTSEVETEFHLQRDARGWMITDVKVNP